MQFFFIIDFDKGDVPFGEARWSRRKMDLTYGVGRFFSCCLHRHGRLLWLMALPSRRLTFQPILPVVWGPFLRLGTDVGGWASSCIRECFVGSWPGKRSVLSRAVCSGAPSSSTCRIGFSVPRVCTRTSSNPQECTGSEGRHWEREGLEGTGGALDN